MTDLTHTHHSLPASVESAVESAAQSEQQTLASAASHPARFDMTARIRLTEGTDATQARTAMAELERATQYEPGCIMFRILEDTSAPGDFILWESWHGREGLEAHFKAEHTLDYLARNMTEVVSITELQALPGEQSAPVITTMDYPVSAGNISVGGAEKTTQVARHNYPELPAPAGPYVHGVRHGNTLYLSGLTAFATPAQTLNIAEQARVIFKQIEQAAQQEGASLQHLIKVTLFVPDLSDIALLRAELETIYGHHKPASSLVEISALFSPDLKLEVEAILALP